MIWHITKREIYDNLNSLRFALTTVLLLALMVTNAVKHLREHPKRVQRYQDAVTESSDRLTTHADGSLYKLAQYGPGNFYKKPSPLHFCANGGESILPDTIKVDEPPVFMTDAEGNRLLEGIWSLSYPDANLQNKSVGPNVSQVDWAFIIGSILSLIALWFTFDAFSGEREHGTLRLMLANSIPRHTVLIGKFLGALLSISIPFALAVLVNLLLIFYCKYRSPDDRSVGTLRYYFLSRAFVHESVCGVRVVSLGACTTERGESDDTAVDVGNPCRFYAEYPRFNCKQLLTCDVLR